MNSVAEAGQRLCWAALRSFLTVLSEQKLREFAEQHQDETFYCLCVYFDGHYGDFFLYLNVPEQARKTAVHLKESFPNLHGQQTVEQVLDEFKWNCGDFLYEYVNVDANWNRCWRPIAQLFEQLTMQLYGDGSNPQPSRQWGERWAETACLVALDLECSEVLKLLKKTPDFRVICVDHDETIEDSFSRLERVRQSYEPLSR
jgi:hypothetical protein